MKILILSLVLGFCLSVFGENIDRIIAVVNGEILTKSDLDGFKKRVKKESLLDDLFDVDYKKLLGNKKQLVDHLIDQKIVDSEIRRLKLNVSPSRIDAEIKKIAANLGVGVSGLKKRLKQDNIAFDDYKEFIKRRLERQSLIQREITSKIRISDDEVKSFYAKNSQNKDTDVFEYSLSHILIKAEDNKAAALERANMVVSKIKNGMDFSKAASQYTEDPNFSSGGYLGTFKSGEFLPAFENAVRNIDEGQVAKPVLVGSNYIILRLNKKQIVENPEFLQLKERIRAQLQQLAFKKQFQFWLSQKRSEADIKIN
jgi:peptidyl-prolyl cis-trans isomerase SurA